MTQVEEQRRNDVQDESNNALASSDVDQLLVVHRWVTPEPVMMGGRVFVRLSTMIRSLAPDLHTPLYEAYRQAKLEQTRWKVQTLKAPTDKDLLPGGLSGQAARAFSDEWIIWDEDGAKWLKTTGHRLTVKRLSDDDRVPFSPEMISALGLTDAEFKSILDAHARRTRNKSAASTGTNLRKKRVNP